MATTKEQLESLTTDMRSVTVHLSSITPYSPSRMHFTPKLDRESADAYEERTWRNKAHTMPDGKVFIPGICFLQSLRATAKHLSMQIPGKGKKTYTASFLSGVVCQSNIVLKLKLDDLEMEKLYLPSDGVAGSGKRVIKRFPVIQEWSGKLTFAILDPVITEAVFRDHIVRAGELKGVGRWRPAVGGMNGRFKVESLDWS